MYAKVYGETTCGINGEQIIVEVDISNGLPSFGPGLSDDQDYCKSGSG